jgi:hypothetical protein
VALGSPPSLCRPSTWAVPDRRVLRSNILRGVKAEKPTPSSSSRWNDPCRPGGGGPGAIFFQMIEILWSVNPTPIVLEPMERSVPARGVEVLEPYFFGRSRSLRSLTPIVLWSESRSWAARRATWSPRARSPLMTPDSGRGPPHISDVVIEKELIRVGAKSHLIDFVRPLIGDVSVDHIGGEHIAFE